MQPDYKEIHLFRLFSYFFFACGLGFKIPSHLQWPCVNCIEWYLLLLWGYSLPRTAICITSWRAQNDILFKTFVYSPMSGYEIFEASFMLLARPLFYDFIVLYHQGRPFPWGVHIQRIFSQHYISTHFRAVRSQCCRVWIHQFALSTCSSRLAIIINNNKSIRVSHFSHAV